MNLPQIIQQDRKVRRDVIDLLEDLPRILPDQRNAVIEAIKAELDKVKTV
jgi:hypothetical protein